MDQVERGPPCMPFYRELRNTAVIKVREFSKADVHKQDAVRGGYDETDESDDGSTYDIICLYYVEVYPNGYDSSTESQVSLKFCLCPWSHSFCSVHEPNLSHLEMTCVVTVADAEGCGRFPQSFAFTHDGLQTETSFSVDSYITRDLLLTAADDLLPDDTLTIQVDVVLKVYYEGRGCRHNSFEELVSISFKTEEEEADVGSTLHHYLRLDSPLAEYVRQESLYFERMCATCMAEKISGYLKILEEEYDTFLGILKILCYLEVDGIDLKFSFQEICEVYALAHLYGIEDVLDTCRCWLRLVFRTSEDAVAISRLAYWYDDSRLRENSVEREKKTVGADIGASDSGQPDEGWTYTLVDDEYTSKKGSVHFQFEWRFKTGDNEFANEYLTEVISDISNCYI